MAASPSSYRCRYHAFLSFRGEDTRKGFTDHLYRALEMAGIHTFRDDDEIERGAEIAVELQKAIQESQVSLIVFSKDYASSRWCLDELAKIMKRKRNDGHMVVPVFYKVDPSDVRKQTGSFGEAFAKHEERFKEEMAKVDEWRRSLRDAADLGGMVLGDQYESQLIQNIVEDIGNKLEPKVLNVAPHMVGIDDRVKGINMWLRDGSADVGVAGIYGMGGIGKTTIAKVAYNMNLDSFQGSSFVADIRATSEQPNGLVRLQMKLLSDIQKQNSKPKKIYSVDEGMSRIKHIVCCKRVLIVLDDVNDLDQFGAILGMREWFHPGSKIIITTRHQHLLITNGISKMFAVQKLLEQESLELFSWHAFRQVYPIQSYMELSTAVAQRCGGLPLALQVLGSSLFGKSEDVWKNAIEKLDVIPDGKVQKVLRISFDTLQDDHDKSLFLHMACFFTGKEKIFTITVLDNLEFFTRIGIQNLVDRCLVQIDHDDKLIMHQLLIDMAREIIRQESPENPGKRSRVWHKDASNVLENITGTETIKGLMLNLHKENTLSNTKRCHAEEYDGNCSRPRWLGFFSWKSNNFSLTELDSDEGNFKTEAFKGMHNLKILLLNNVKFSGCYNDFPKKLSWLCWQGFPSESIPKEFHLRTLVVLELQNSKLKFVWEGKKTLPRLKILDLSHSLGLVTTPDLSGLSNLERLILNGCTNIAEIDESIGDLENLVFLNLEDCKNLEKLPETICKLTSLKELNLSGCSKLALHSNTATDMKNFFSLLSNKSWQSIWSHVSPRKGVEPTGLSLVNLPHSIVRLSLAHCHLSEIPNDLHIFSSLKELDLSGNQFMSLPENMKNIIVLKSLRLNGCTNLIMLPELPPNLDEFFAINCTSVKKLPSLPNTSINILIGCGELVEVQSVFSIRPLIGELDMEMIRNMGLCNLEPFGRTEELEMINCLTSTTRTCPLQGLYECGIFSIFLHGSMIPNWYKYRGETALSIIVPSHPKLKIKGLNVCVVYTRDCVVHKFELYISLFLKVSNEAKGLMWSYSPVSVGRPKENEEMSWLSHWQFENDELEGGEELCFSVDTEDVRFLIKEIGVQLVYEHENEGKACNGIQSSIPEDVTTQHEAPSWSQGVLIEHVAAPKYQIWPGKYFLCNHYSFPGRFDFSKAYPMGGYRRIFEHQDFEKRVLGQKNLLRGTCFA
ncbi:disease resistance protein RPV1-like [Rosa rugosa]|uniref:disease resistance protein RPV1-like n=1 Tax=Rosa rugosa TaxID=74645 RepID=UPI002B412864|nr:disease resistance protein RPV1-like [Rosa rugosa]